MKEKTQAKQVVGYCCPQLMALSPRLAYKTQGHSPPPWPNSAFAYCQRGFHHWRQTRIQLHQRHKFLQILLMLNSGASPLHLIFRSIVWCSIKAEGQRFFLHWTAVKEPNHPAHRRPQIQFYIRWIAKHCAFALSVCLVSSYPRICNKAGDNTPFLHPSPAGFRGSYPTHLMILASFLPFATVATFVTCQLIRPRRHQHGQTTRPTTMIVFIFIKRYQMFTESYPKGFYVSLGALPTEWHLWVSKQGDFISSSIGSHF